MTGETAAAVFVVCVWHEDGRFRARIRRTRGVPSDPPRPLYATDPAQVAAYLDSWLEELPRKADSPAPGR